MHKWAFTLKIRNNFLLKLSYSLPLSTPWKTRLEVAENLYEKLSQKKIFEKFYINFILPAPRIRNSEGSREHPQEYIMTYYCLKLLQNSFKFKLNVCRHDLHEGLLHYLHSIPTDPPKTFGDCRITIKAISMHFSNSL